MPGSSYKKTSGNLYNEHGMFLTGSKGLGLLSVFLLCDEAEIVTAPADKKVHRIILDKTSGTVEDQIIDQDFENHFTRVILNNVNVEIIDFLTSESEVRKLRHICSYLYKSKTIPFPIMKLHISGQNSQELNFSCIFPPMLYDVCFEYSKDTGELHFSCKSPDKPICDSEVIFSQYGIDNLQEVMLKYYGIKETIPTRTNDLILTDFSSVPTFEGRILVYEKSMAGSQLKTYGAGVNVYVNDFALYNYLAEENDWLGLADYSQRKKVTRLKPHNVFGYLNFPHFDENIEKLQISNERADFIQDMTFSKLMYMLKGVVMFAILNIDVADKNPKYKETANDSQYDESQDSDNEVEKTEEKEQTDSIDELTGEGPSDSTPASDQYTSTYTPENQYKPRQNVQKNLVFTRAESKAIESIKGADNLCNKIYNLVFELSRLDLQVHRHSIAYLYRALIESSTKYIAWHQQKISYNKDNLESSVVNTLNYFSENIKRVNLSDKTVKTWRDTVCKRKIIDILNEYIHNEQPVDAYLLQETWFTMKGYVIACLTVS
jgi:hypothetical protein